MTPPKGVRSFTIAVPSGWRVERVELVPNDGTNRMRALRFPETPIAEQPLELGPEPTSSRPLFIPSRGLAVTLAASNGHTNHPPARRRPLEILDGNQDPPVALTKAGKKKGVHGKRCGNAACGERSGPRAASCMCGWNFVTRSMPRRP
jgi:hypothetical protein